MLARRESASRDESLLAAAIFLQPVTAGPLGAIASAWAGGERRHRRPGLRDRLLPPLSRPIPKHDESPVRRPAFLLQLATRPS